MTFWPLNLDDEEQFLDYLEEFDRWMAFEWEKEQEKEFERLRAALAARDGWI